MRDFATFYRPQTVKNAASFATTEQVFQAKVRAYIEPRHASAAWVNRAAYTNATHLLRIRTIPGLEISTDMVVETKYGLFAIDTIEDVKGRGRYLEILAHEVVKEGSRG